MPENNSEPRQFPYLENNLHALERFAETYANIKEAFEDDPCGAISYLRVLGFVCATCGKNQITWPIMRFCHYRPDAQCYECQRRRKNFTPNT